MLLDRYHSRVLVVRFIVAFFGIIGLVSLASGCSFDSSLEGVACQADRDCPNNAICVDNYCLDDSQAPGLDAQDAAQDVGDVLDDTPDANPDAKDAVDASPDTKDIISDVCDREVDDCGEATCTDGIQNGSETDIDCGGSCQARCGSGSQCAASTDCTDNATCTGAPAACLCDEGFQADENGRCVDIDECAEEIDNCDANASCTNNNGGFACTCNGPEYVGDGLSCFLATDCSNGNAVCDANAECTDAGNGQSVCECLSGYTGDGMSCADIDECTTNTDNCDPLATCTNTDGSYTCANCPAGYDDVNGNATSCVDIDECTTGANNCDPLATCTNTDGSYTCANCPAGYDDVNGDATSCIDIDECTTGADNCDLLATCTNTDGSFTCACPTGYSGDGTSCADIDECVTDADNCITNEVCTNTPGSFTCACADGMIDDGTGCRLPTSCLEGLNNGIATDGVYTLDPDGAGATAAFDAYCDMTTNGGGWTLAIKADGRETTFRYGKNIWENTDLLNPNSPDLDRTEAKLDTFNSVAFTDVMIGLEHPIGNSTLNLTYLVIPKTANSLYAVFQDGFQSTNLGRAVWKNTITGSSLQENCNREGFNNNSGFSRVRIGILGNEQDDCNSPDSYLGIGGNARNSFCGQENISVGNAAGCSPDDGDVNLRAFGVVFVR